MSWEHIQETFDYSLSKDKINSEVYSILADSNSCFEYKGSFEKICFVETTVYKDETEAANAVRRLQRNRGDNIAVPFWDFSEYASQKLCKLDNRIAKAHECLEKAMSERYLTSISCKLVSCRTCGSLLSREHLLFRERNGSYYDHCPVCNGNLKPKSRLARIEELRTKWEQLKAERAEEAIRLSETLMSHPERYGRKMWYVDASIYVG